MPLPRAILCIDFDGTLIDEQIHIHPADVEILELFPATIQPVMTTGRDLRSVKSIFQNHGVFKAIPFPWPGVFMNGG
jgi:hydroxymethylpyrimidine pyrophosphatase-like HAD family hydrolase